MEAVAAGDEIAREFVRAAIPAPREARRVGLDAMDRNVSDVELERAARREARSDQVLDHLLLAIHGDRTAAGERGEVNAVTASREAEFDAVMRKPFARQALAHAGALQQ